MFTKLMHSLIGTPAQRHAAQQEIEVYIAANDFGGWSIYPLNAAARALFNGDGPTGNFPTAQEAERRAARHNCWTVKAVIQPAEAAQAVA